MELKLSDLIEVSVLQRIQDAFSAMTGMAALVTEPDGTEVTVGSHFTDYCKNYARKSCVGSEHCRECDRYGMKEAMELKKSVVYKCYSGLIDFSAPIVAQGQLVGCFIGGQVCSETPDEELVRKIAEEYGIDYGDCLKAMRKVPILPRKKIDAAAEFLYVMAGVMSDIAYSRYQALEASREVERIGNMKADFLASMSHEIRTPMNAVLGMTEMALRENLPPAARNYMQQIKSSGKVLLNIINDILDLSKIESGKMTILPVEYELLSLCNDIAGIIETRLKDKRVELMMSVDPAIPCRLYGDNVRIRQILINLANNAVKFTQKGKIEISIGYSILDEHRIRLKIDVSDTGCGIKPEDQKKIFDSFQQVDSRRNREAEGTGLGLAICKRFLDLMGGEIYVSSVYEKGSAFTVIFPQEVIDWKPSIQAKEAQESMIAIGYFKNRFLARHFFEDMRRLRVISIAMISSDRLEWGLDAYEKEIQGKQLILFTDEKDVDEAIRVIPDHYPNIKVVELVDFFSDKKSTSSNWSIMRKPLSTSAIAMALDGKELELQNEDMNEDAIDFVAPEAKVLIVDDNAVNLTVTEGLLQPLQMKVYSITSGIEAVDLIEQNQFDLIFMDHMMPEMDGIQTTRVIRRFHPKYKDVPIIALTANVVEGMKDEFLKEGMNDFVAKPIEVRTLIQKVKQWLPKEKICKNRKIVGADEHMTSGREMHPIAVGDLNTEAACRLLGNEALFWTVLKEYYKAIPQKAKLIGQLKQQGKWQMYTVEVHALKSASRQIGAEKLADLAALLEKAGHNGDIETIRERTDEMLSIYTGYSTVLAPYCEEKEENTERLSVDWGIMHQFFSRLCLFVQQA